MRIEKFADMNQVRVEGKAFVDASAERTRGLFITPGSGQAMVYQQKVEEAEAFMVNPAIALSEIPHIAAEAEQYGITPYDQAVIILTMREQWKQVSTLIEMRRLAAKDAISVATTPAEVAQLKVIDWSDVEQYV